MVKEHKNTHAWGIASLVLSIVGLMLIFAPYIGIFCSILAVVFYGIQKKHEPTGVATAGLVVGIIGIVINAIMLIFVVGLLAFFGFVGTLDDATVQPTENVLGSQEAIPSDSNTQKVKSATLTIDRVTETAANLGKIRLTVTNTGDVSIRPNFDVAVTSDSGSVVCEDSPMFGVGSVSAGEKITDEIQILACMFEKDGTYDVTVDLLDEDYNKLDTTSKELTVNYWGQFDFG